MRFMEGSVYVVSALFASSLLAASANPKDNRENQVQIVRPESYAVRRFQEVVDQNKPKDDTSVQEELIASRAKLMIAEQRLQDLKQRHREQQANPPAGESALVKEVHLRAAQAQIDHYAKLVRRYESQILHKKNSKKKP